jgi:predicted transposase YbfD/YdcC
MAVEIIDYFDNVKLESLIYHEERDTGHGRMEVRKYYISSDIDCISSKNEWANLNTIGMTESLRHVGGKNSIQKKYYIASILPEVIVFAGATRKHWGIENSLHWCLDVGFREDECRIRKGFAAENMAVVRHIALNMLKNEKTSRRGIAGKRFNAALNNNDLEKVLNF